MAEVRYRGTKVVTVSPDYADNTKFADEWMPAQAGTDAALAMAMGHVLLKEFFVDRRTPFFVDYVQQFTDLPFLIRLEEHDGVDGQGGLVPGKFLTSADLGGTTDEDAWKTVLLDGASGQPVVPNGSMGFRYADSGKGKWNLDLEGVSPTLTLAGEGSEPAEVLLPAFVDADGTGSVLRRGVPTRRVGGHLVTTVFDLMLAQYGGGSMIIMGAGICQWFHGDATYRAILSRLVDWFGYGVTHIIIAVALVAVAFLVWTAMRDSPAWQSNSDAVVPKLVAAAKLPVTWQMSFLYAVAFGGFVAFSTYLPTYLKDVYEFDLTVPGPGPRASRSRP